MQVHAKILLITFALLLSVGEVASAASGNNAMGARGGSFLQLHPLSLSAFDSEIDGTPLVLGGEGYATVAKNLRIGGSGGGGFLWNASNNAQFALGYGGFLGEYVVKNWFNVRVLIGGGGYAVTKTVLETQNQITDNKLASGGFILVYPSIGTEFNISGGLRMGIRLGYFLPNADKLASLTLGFHLYFGK